MPNINEMKGPSKYLSKEDVGRGALVTVKGIEQRNVAREGDSPEFRWLMHFMEGHKPLVLNSTNIQLAARICGSENTDDWTGRQLVLYTDPNVSYAGKLVGGIRIRAPKPQAVNHNSTISQAVAATQQIKAAAAKWTRGHAMPHGIPEDSPNFEPAEAAAILAEDDIPFSWVIGLMATGLSLLHLAPILT